MTRSTIVYLDSQDFSRIANPPRGAEAFYANLQESLDGLISDGLVEVRYSAVHISEIAHTKLGAATFSAARARVLKHLCRGKCMPFWTEILTSEVEHALGLSGSVEALRDGDRWIDVDPTAIGGFLENLRGSLDETLKSKGYNRHRRRAAATIDWIKLLTQTRDGEAVLDGIVDAINAKFPLDTELDRATLVAYVSGRTETEEFGSYLRSLLTDPVNLIERVAIEFDTGLRIPALVRDLGKDFVTRLDPVVDKIINVYSALPSLMPEPTVSAMAHRLVDTAGVRIRRSMIRDRISKSQLTVTASPVQDSELDGMDLPALDAIVAVFAKCLHDLVTAARARKPARRFRPTDAGDLFHATYVPYVDVFRCDTAWVNALSPVGRKHGTTIVGRIEDLMPAIMECITRKTS